MYISFFCFDIEKVISIWEERPTKIAWKSYFFHISTFLIIHTFSGKILMIYMMVVLAIVRRIGPSDENWEGPFVFVFGLGFFSSNRPDEWTILWIVYHDTFVIRIYLYFSRRFSRVLSLIPLNSSFTNIETVCSSLSSWQLPQILSDLFFDI